MATTNTALDTDALEQLFTEARTHSGWQDRPVTDETLRRIYELARMAPTAINSQPVRLVFVRSREAKERLKPALSPGNVDKTMQAPVTVIVAYDTAFHEQMPKLFPARDMKSVFAAMPQEAREQAAFMNGTLQGGYVILAARALGLDCGPMGGFDKAKVDEAFLQGTGWKSNFLINLGYGDPAKLFPRNPRLSFEDACRLD
ncbi:malonic semialdehyde reductase [Corallococcus exiguus]|uniref:Putative NADH dehydrogenase/NAD(P)H nitroreductase GTZ93_38805 n=1 Tax=Corallococcus exiguus TaxID=83462 RepID=A0A7X4YHZ5_9BACT|nr:malonic semialdehyde reductase [Corallococcus exiguus]NBC45759.1 malonic semialdehyde reductase [Corallococcus exiguus]TNV51757.1 malonic semialdehyde reductase [Corallococcus exiguus]